MFFYDFISLSNRFEKVSYFREVGRKFGKWLGIVDYELIL